MDDGPDHRRRRRDHLLRRAASCLAAASLLAASVAAAQPAAVGARLEVVRQLYAAYPADAPGVQVSTADRLARHFDPEMVKLFVRDAACARKHEAICNLDFDPMWASQDAEGGKVLIAPGPRGLVSARISYPDSSRPTELLYDVRQTGQGWRIHDIIDTSGGETLRQRLAH